jgi:hypothetical protein
MRAMKSWRARRARGAHRLVGGAREAVRDVVAHRVVEQDGLLRDDPELGAQRGERHVAQVARRPR